MHKPLVANTNTNAGYHGLRMSADEYLALPEDPFARYELIDGVICMSPSPIFRHQVLLAEITGQLHDYLVSSPMGITAVEVDVRLGDDLVYRPDLVFLSHEKAARCNPYITEVPDLIMEILSPSSHRMDQETKRGDYEKAGVGEYWIVNPDDLTVNILILRDGQFKETDAGGAAPSSVVLPGFALDIERMKNLFDHE